jgi:glycine betaine/proline transport system ATP-binding protein
MATQYIPSENISTTVDVSHVWKIFGARADEAMAAIEHENISKKEVLSRYGCVVGVQDATFSVSEGEVFCIMGLSGSGKSTLVRHINRLLEPTSGSITIHGEDVMKKDAQQLRLMRAEKIGMVFQNIALLPHRTVFDNVALPLDVKGISRRQCRETVDRALSLVELSGWEFHYAHELSGGMQQRVGLARAMAADPDILLMDEPFSALDPLIRRQLQDEFIKLSQITNKTTIFITHDLDEAIRIGHRIAIMKDGVLVQIGTPEEIVTNPVDEYVAEFVAGISRLKLISAASVMIPLDSYLDSNTDLTSAPRVPEVSDLDHLIDVSLENPGPMVITADDGTEVGIVEREQLLRGIQGNREQRA